MDCKAQDASVCLWTEIRHLGMSRGFENIIHGLQDMG